MRKSLFLVFFFSFPNTFQVSNGILGYVWFLENSKENARERKYGGNVKKKEKNEENKIKIKPHMLFLLIASNKFYFF